MYMVAKDGSGLMKNSNFREPGANDKRTENINNTRTVLHCDANAFFASCETVLHPEYALVPMAVCGSTEDRHGIVLAKNELAKKYKIKTGETVWQAKQKCPSLLTVKPTYGLYSEMSKKMNDIFYEYTDLVEQFGIDESWLDVSGSKKLFGSGKDIADSIRKRIRTELGITVSIGVSFNKIFAKLGSDLKKPDATSVIPPDRFASIVWPLPVGALLFVGPSCSEKLGRVGIKTIGDLACCDSEFISQYMGKNGIMLRDFALGRDFAEVTPAGYEPEPKSVSHGMTFRFNLVSKDDISFAVTYLSMSIAERLRKHGLCCNTVAVSIRNPNQITISRRVPLSNPTCLYEEISDAALKLIYANVKPDEEIYSVTVHAEKLSSPGQNEFQQIMFPCERELAYQKRLSLECTIDSIHKRYGKKALCIASAVNNRLV